MLLTLFFILSLLFSKYFFVLRIYFKIHGFIFSLQNLTSLILIKNDSNNLECEEGGKIQLTFFLLSISLTGNPVSHKVLFYCKHYMQTKLLYEINTAELMKDKKM